VNHKLSSEFRFLLGDERIVHNIASLFAKPCPATLTMPVCCGLLPHCGQKGVFAACGFTMNVTVIVAGDP
jgi:hypothetical protein